MRGQQHAREVVGDGEAQLGVDGVEDPLRLQVVPAGQGEEGSGAVLPPQAPRPRGCGGADGAWDGSGDGQGHSGTKATRLTHLPTTCGCTRGRSTIWWVMEGSLAS